MFLWSFFLAPSFLVHMARVIPFLKTPTFVRSGFCQIYPHSVISSNSVKYFIAVESRRICKNLYIFVTAVEHKTEGCPFICSRLKTI
jgi:hypothetical protein